VGFSYFLATGAGLALALLIVALGRFSIGHYNPAVTLGLWSIRKINTLDSIAYIAAQFLGASVAWRLYMYLANTDLKNIAGKHQLDWRVFTAEAIGALILVTVVAAAVYHNFRTLKWALAAGGGLFLGMLISSLGSNGIVNPAVALGLQSWNASYALGPLVGGLVGAGLYSWLFAPAAGLETAPVRYFANRRKSASARVSSASTADRADKAGKEAADKPAKAKPAPSSAGKSAKTTHGAKRTTARRTRR
jgi:glycerol uptake facilitator-like aquaporin